MERLSLLFARWDGAIEQKMISFGLGDLIKLLDEMMGKRGRKIYVWAILAGAGIFIVGLPMREIVVPLVTWLFAAAGQLQIEPPVMPAALVFLLWGVWAILLGLFAFAVWESYRSVARGRRHEAEAARQQQIAQRYNHAAQQAYRAAEQSRAEAEGVLADARRISTNAKRAATRAANRRR